MVKYNDEWIHFGDKRYEQYEDNAPLQLYKDQNHYDKKDVTRTENAQFI